MENQRLKNQHSNILGPSNPSNRLLLNIKIILCLIIMNNILNIKLIELSFLFNDDAVKVYIGDSLILFLMIQV